MSHSISFLIFLFLSLIWMCLSDTLTCTHSPTAYSSRGWWVGVGTMWGLANKWRNILTCEPQIMRSKSGAEGSGLGRWPLAITACGSHTGASAARPSGSRPRRIPAWSPPQAFPPQAIAYSCLPDKRSQRARGLKGALRELSRKPSVLDLSWNDYTVRKIFWSWSQKIVSSCA